MSASPAPAMHAYKHRAYGARTKSLNQTDAATTQPIVGET